MKLKSLIMFSAAALAFAACSNEEDMTAPAGFSDGTGAISVKVVNPATRTITDPSTGATIKVGGGDITVKLFNASGAEIDQAVIPAAQVGTATVKFWNVQDPGEITVSRNGGVADYSTVSIVAETPAMQAEPELIPVYGSTKAFTPTSSNESPALADDDNIIDGDKTQEADKNKKFQMYTATVEMEIPVARLEVSGIKHIVTGKHESDDCKFATLSIDGVYLDNVKPTGAGVLTDYLFEEGAGTGVVAILKDAVDAEHNDFMLADAVWPADDQVYAYNFYAPAEDDAEATAASNPAFKIYFKNATGSDEPVSAPRYAVIENYMDIEGNPVVMKAGHIYRVVGGELTDENITGDEGGETLYGITVTVVEATWQAVDLTADWAE